nr:hypothetical protein Iba_chr09dCG10270 [Ipomoea batatas]
MPNSAIEKYISTVAMAFCSAPPVTCIMVRKLTDMKYRAKCRKTLERPKGSTNSITPIARAACKGLRPSPLSFLQKDGIMAMVSTAKRVLPLAAATCSGVSTNGISLILFRISGSSWIDLYRAVTSFALAAIVNTFQWDWEGEDIIISLGATCNGLRPSPLSFLQKDGIMAMVSTANSVVPFAAATCSGVSTNGISLIFFRISGSYWIDLYRAVTSFSLAAFVSTSQWDWEG